MFLPLRSNNGVPNSVSTFFSTMLSAGWVIKSAFDADVMFFIFCKNAELTQLLNSHRHLCTISFLLIIAC